MARVWMCRVALLLLLVSVSCMRAAPASQLDDAMVIDPPASEEDSATCPVGCTCSLGAVSNLVVQCRGSQGSQENSLLPKLQASMEGFVTRLDISGSQIPVLIDDFLSDQREYSKSLHSLRISNSSVSKITELAFKSGRLLEEVDLSLNELTYLPSEIFNSTSCPSLRMVSLSHNVQLNFPRRGAFLKSISIEELDVSYCGVTIIHAHSLARLPKLAYLNLEGNLIEIIHPEAFARLDYIEEINLSGNQIVNLPSRLSPTLQKLTLRNNFRFNVSSLTELSPEMAISELDISGCNIKELPRNIFLRLNDLTYLNVSHNALKNLYFPFVLRQLRYLDLSYNALSGPMYENLLSSCSQLETLSLAWNTGLQLPEDGFTGEFTSVYKLDLSGCAIDSLSSSAIADFTGIAHLNLSNNALQSLQEDIFEGFPSLNTLDLSFNELNSIPNSIFQDNMKLKILSLAYNPNLSPVLDSELLQNNAMLKTLDISSCDFVDIPDTLPIEIENFMANDNKFRDPTKLTALIETTLYSLRTISITDNPWKCNFEFKQLISILRERQIIDEGMDSGSWSEYQGYVCLTERIAEEILQANAQRPRDVVRSHFWSLLSFSLTLMAFIVVAGGVTVACRGRVKGGLGRSYRHLSDSSTVCSTGTAPHVPNKIYREPPQPLQLEHEGALKPTTFSAQPSLLFPRFPVSQSEIPTSYVSGNYHHQELVP